MSSTPLVSVIMPVYNTAPFLREAIDSILNQTLTDFELILIDDASTDESASILHAYSDERIRIIQNEKNLGLAVSLNKAIRVSKGKFIARMDGDDVSLAHRLELQASQLQKLPHHSVVCSTCILIDEQGNKIGKWKDDSQYLTAKKIRAKLPSNNCIVHPSIIMRRELLLEYFYDPEQSAAEDYDLWLRMAAEGVMFHKFEEPLVLYRIRKQSFTRERQHNVFFKLFRIKIIFLFHGLIKGQANGFMAKTLLYAMIDLIKGAAKEIKKGIKR